MNYLKISLDDALAMARRHGHTLIDLIDFDDDSIPVWASNNYLGYVGAPGDIDELCGHACHSVGAYTRGVISQEIYLRAMENIDHMLYKYYNTSLAQEWFR